MRVPPACHRLLVTLALATSFASVPSLLADPASAKIFRWVDDTGTPHFSDRAEDVPPRYRYQLDEAHIGSTSDQAARFVVVPGLNGARTEDGEPVRPLDEAAFEAEALAALAGERAGGGFTPDVRELLEAGAPMVAGLVVLALLGILLGLAVAAWILRLACRICGEEPPGLGKGMGIVVLQSLAVSALGVIVGIFVLGGGGGIQAQSAQFGAGVLIQAGVLRAMQLESYGKSLAVVAVAIAIQLAIGLVLGLGIFALVAAMR